MENITIENVDYKNYHFTYAQYFGYKILINKDDGYINISKLLNIINEEHKKNNKPIKEFKELKRNKDYNEFIDILNEKLNKKLGGENTRGLKLTYEIREGRYENHINGIYIHEDLLNYVLMWADKKYALFVNDIMKKLNNNQYEEIKTIKEKYETENEKLQIENEKLKEKIELSKPRLIPEQTNELSTNQIIRIYKIDDNEYKLSYDQNKKLKYELIGEFIFNCASNISKSDGLKQFYINNSTRTFNKDKLNDVINYLDTATKI